MTSHVHTHKGQTLKANGLRIVNLVKGEVL